MNQNHFVDKYPLSSSQKDIWVNQILYPNIPLYNVGGYLVIHGSINSTLFEKSLNQVIQRNDGLRLTLHRGETLPTQTVAEDVVINLDVHDFSGEDDNQRKVLEWMKQEFSIPFQLYNNILFQFSLCKVSDQCYYWFQKYHYLIADGKTLSLIVQKVANTYNDLLMGQPSTEGNHLSYTDFIKEDQAYLRSKEFDRDMHYWREKYVQIPEKLIRSRYASEIGNQVVPSQSSTLSLSWEFYDGLITFSQRYNLSVFLVILAALYCYFSKITGKNDFVIGFTTQVRRDSKFDETTGFFTNITPARFFFDTNLSFMEVARAIDFELQRDAPYTRAPIGEINRQAKFNRKDRQQLFELELAYIDFDFDTDFSGSLIEFSLLSHGFEQYPLAVYAQVFHKQRSIRINFDYNLSAFNQDEIGYLKARFEFLLKEVLEHPDIPVSELRIMPDKELHRILFEFNNATTVSPTDKTIIDLFDEQVKKTPDACAVALSDQRLSYRQLHRKANRLAHYLQSIGVGNETLVGIFMERLMNMIIGLLGIMKAGGAYIPLDPAYPAERLAFMLEDANPPVLLTQSDLADTLLSHAARTVCLDDLAEVFSQYSPDNPVKRVGLSDLAYVIYTSGSTGQPKGVLVEHRGLSNLTTFQIQAFGVYPGSRILQFVSLSFDVAISDIAMALCSGATLCLVTQEVLLSQSGLLQTLYEQSVTHMEIPVSILSALPVVDLPALKTLIVGGDVCTQEVVTNWSKGRRFFNAYGPTETTVCATVAECTDNREKPHIGHPIANTQVYILDEYGKPTPMGVPGELHIGGIGLARGYLNRPDLMAEKFIPNPFQAGTHLYKTGDLACYLPDGNIDFLGRIDRQVKIRGFRIEPGEIEAVLTEHERVQEAAVIASEELEDKRLLAYFVPRPYDALPDDSETIDAGSRVEQWRQVHDDAYSQLTDSDMDPRFNTAGWNSSYTGAPIPREEMQEWLDGTVERILANAPKRVLEIGCGSGMVVFRIAPHCEHYTATDLSPEALDYLEQQQKTWEFGQRLTLLQRAADDFDGIEEGFYDGIILNSVVQYFPSIDYLLTVLTSAVTAVAPGGFIFLGDVRNLQFLEELHASVQFHRADNSVSMAGLKQRVRRGMRKEEELLIDPDFFIALKRHLPQITHVQIQLKTGRAHNEMSCFRYDVTLHVGGGAPIDKVLDGQFQRLDWQGEKLTLAKVREILAGDQSELIAFENIPNARLMTEKKILERLFYPEESVGELRASIGQPDDGIEPEEFRALIRDLPYTSHIDYQGKYDYSVVFRHQDSRTIPYPEKAGDFSERAWSTYANNPLQNAGDGHELVPQLRDFLSGKLPDYMVPSLFVPIGAMPLTPNGKVDREALARLPVEGHLSAEKTFTPPKTPEEKLLASAWAEILGLEKVGLHDHFFELGGDSIKGMQLLGKVQDRLKQDIPFATLFKAPTIAEFAAYLKQAPKLVGEKDNATDDRTAIPTATPELKPVPRVPGNNYFPLSFQQARRYRYTKANPNHRTNNFIESFRIDGPLDAEILRESFDEIVRRHEILRTVLKEQGDSIVQVVHPTGTAKMSIVDIRSFPEGTKGKEIERLMREERGRPFDPANDYVMRLTLIRLEQESHALVFCAYGFITENWSTGVLFKELSIIYEAFSAGKSSPLPPLSIQYGDYAKWQHDALALEVVEAKLDYWRKWFKKGEPPSLTLPVRCATSLAAQTLRGEARSYRFSPELTWQLRELGRRTGTTLFMVLASAFVTLLYRYSDCDDVVIGSFSANRSNRQLQSLIGVVGSMMMLRVDLGKSPSFSGLLARVQKVMLAAFTYQDVPFEHFAKTLQPERRRKDPLSKVHLTFFPESPREQLKLPGLTVTHLDKELTTKIDLGITIWEEKTDQGKCIRGWWQYKADLFEAETIAEMTENFQRLLDGIVSNPEQSIDELPYRRK
uniref:Amino acid adenylation domain-containing protein n=1 Tax=Candidatus Kentrum sp. FW TaxID=2126338 RepID=A0A450SFT2_9GAMM|nr:MAG: amino acid adenylation domain-containing protein [Candidatus Kentron sp. FW]